MKKAVYAQKLIDKLTEIARYSLKVREGLEKIRQEMTVEELEDEIAEEHFDNLIRLHIALMYIDTDLAFELEG